MNTNEKGTLGLIQIIKDLVEHGYEVFTPFSEHCAIDLIAHKEGKIYRVQVKYRELLYPKAKLGARTARPPYIEVPMHTVVNGKRVPYDISKLDIFAVYSPQWGITYVMPKPTGYSLKEHDFGKTLDEVLLEWSHNGIGADC